MSLRTSAHTGVAIRNQKEPPSVRVAVFSKFERTRSPAGEPRRLRQSTGLSLRAAFRVRSSDNKKRSHPEWDDFFFGDLERTRTVDLQRDRLAC